MIDVQQFREHIVRPTLKYLGMYSLAAENLLVGTALVESKLTYLKQLHGGPALGVYQMEPATHDDIYEHYLVYKTDLRELVYAMLPHSALAGEDVSALLKGDLYYATAMARIHYRRVKAPLPHHDDVAGMGKYYKQYYNTPLGKGTAQGFVDAYIE